MFLAIAAYFRANPDDLTSIVDFVLGQRVDDGGYNCRSNRSGCRVASVHTTASVIDGFTEYLGAGNAYRADEIRRARAAACECLLARRLYQVKGSGVPIHPEAVKLHHPARWHFDVLRGLEVVTEAGMCDDDRCCRHWGGAAPPSRRRTVGRQRRLSGRDARDVRPDRAAEPVGDAPGQAGAAGDVRPRPPRWRPAGRSPSASLNGRSGRPLTHGCA